MRDHRREMWHHAIVEAAATPHEHRRMRTVTARLREGMMGRSNRGSAAHRLEEQRNNRRSIPPPHPDLDDVGNPERSFKLAPIPLIVGLAPIGSSSPIRIKVTNDGLAGYHEAGSATLSSARDCQAHSQAPPSTTITSTCSAGHGSRLGCQRSEHRVHGSCRWPLHFKSHMNTRSCWTAQTSATKDDERPELAPSRLFAPAFRERLP